MNSSENENSQNLNESETIEKRQVKNKKFLFTGVIIIAIMVLYATIIALRPDIMQIQQSQTVTPKDIDGCFVELERLLKPEDIKKMRAGSERDMAKYNFGIGLWMRNNWLRPKGSHLAQWFYAQRIYNPDDMSGIILTSFWRHLNKKPIRLEEQIKQCQDSSRKLESTN